MPYSYVSIEGLILFTVLFFHGLAAFYLVEKILKTWRTSKYVSLICSAVYALSTIVSLTIFTVLSAPTFLTILVVFTISFFICFKAHPLPTLICSMAISLHVIAMRTIITATYALQTGISCYSLSVGSAVFITLGVSTMILIIVTMMVAKIIPARYLESLITYPKNSLFLVLIFGMFNFYLLFNATLFENPKIVNSIVPHQIIVTLVILISSYLGFFLIARLQSFHSYKEKSEKLEKSAVREAYFKNIVLSDTVSSYEVNCTKNTLAVLYSAGEEHAIRNELNYGVAIAQIVRSFVHDDDVEWVTAKLMPESIISEHNAGNQEFSIEYRRSVNEGQLIWVGTSVNISVDEPTGDIVALITVKNIDKEKQEQLELRNRAERDSLTGAYNKQATHHKIMSFILQNPNGALIILDVDDFKSVNDNMGHAYGDSVLCKMVNIINGIFRDDDIVGRVGGDEFMIFMKHTATESVIISKAKLLCKSIEEAYSEEPYKVCCSVGIARFPEHGSNFDDLYEHADIALYRSKNSGKNTYTMYDETELSSQTSVLARTEIESLTSTQNTTVKNRKEHVFDILFNASDLTEAIHSVFNIVMTTYRFDRAHLYNCIERSGAPLSLPTFSGDNARIEASNFKKSQIPNFLLNEFDASGGFFVSNTETLQASHRNYLSVQNVKSQYIFPLWNHDNLLGFATFSSLSRPISLSKQETDDIITIFNILSIFYHKHLHTKDSDNYLKAITTVLDRLEHYVYVINKSDYKILFLNQMAASLSGTDDCMGKICYEVLRGRTTPCEDCPMAQLPNDNLETKKSSITYNDKLGKKFTTTASYLKWVDNTMACLLDNTNA